MFYLQHFVRISSHRHNTACIDCAVSLESKKNMHFIKFAVMQFIHTAVVTNHTKRKELSVQTRSSGFVGRFARFWLQSEKRITYHLNP